MENFDHKRKDLITRIDQAKQEKRKLMFLDEVNFTKLSILKLDYSVKGKNTQVDQERIYTGYHSVIVTVSAERGLELYNIYDKAVKGAEFADHLNKLR